MVRYIVLLIIIVLVALGSYLFLTNRGYLSQSNVDSTQETSSQITPAEANVDELINKDWIWAETVFPEGNKVTPLGEKPFIVIFASDGSVSAQTDCNTFMGSYETSAPNNISIIANASTLMACEGAQEPEFMEALGRAKTFSIENDQLILLLSDNSKMYFR